MHTEEKKKKKVLWAIIFALCLCIFAVCFILLILYFFPRNNHYSEYKQPVSSINSEVELPDNPIDFQSLLQTNEDVIGWINIPGTTIDYPILQSSEEEEESFYLTHGLDKKYLFDGCIYIQKMNYADFTDPNTVIYGHDLANGEMFTPLRKYRKADFFQTNDLIHIYLPGHSMSYRIFSAFVFDDRHILNSFNFYDNEEYAAFLNHALKPTSFVKNVREDVPVTTADRIITLSTCTNRDNERYLVCGVLIEDILTK